MSFEAAVRIADAVLYEGYALYPYRASAAKNRIRWQFGVLMPRAFAETDGGDPWAMQTECLIEPLPGAEPDVDIRVRCLHLRSRIVEAQQGDTFVRVPSRRIGGRDLVEWDEGMARAIDAGGWNLTSLIRTERAIPIDFEAVDQRETITGEDGAIVRIGHVSEAVRGRIAASVEPAGACLKLRVRIENLTDAPEALVRGAALRRAMLGVHTLVHVRGGRFLSLLDPPAEAAELAAGCRNQQTWPVLVGDSDRRDLLLSAPIVLYDFPQVAPESPGNLFDGTEIDEILSLRVMTLTDEEKAEARATDARVRELIDRTDALTADAMADLHGTMRETGEPAGDDAAFRDLLNPPGEASPEEAAIEIDGRRIARDSRVRIEPARRADPIDLIVRGRIGRVQGVYRDLDGRAYLALVLDDDPAGDLHAEYGRFLYYGPEEVVPV